MNIEPVHRHRPSPDDYKITDNRPYFSDRHIDSLRRQPALDDEDDEGILKEHERQVWDIEKLRTKALGHPFHPGLILPPVLYIEPVIAPPNARPVPSFALNGGSFKLRIHRAIVPFEGDPQYWHMWLAKVVLPDGREDCGDVVVKVFQQSLMQSPLRSTFDPSATQLACSEDWVYGHLTQIQGIHVPYCFGLYKIELTYGESIYVLLLEWIDALHSPHNLIDDGVALEPSGPVWDEKKQEDIKQIILSAVRSLRALNFECGVFLHENGEQNHHLLLREPGKPPQIIIINFSECMAEIEHEERERLHYEELMTLLGRIGVNRYFKKMGLKEWAHEHGIPKISWIMDD